MLFNNTLVLMTGNQGQILCVEDWTLCHAKGSRPQGLIYTLSHARGCGLIHILILQASPIQPFLPSLVLNSKQCSTRNYFNLFPVTASATAVSAKVASVEGALIAGPFPLVLHKISP